MENFLEWTDADIKDAHRLFNMAVKVGDRGAAEHMRSGVAKVIEARFMAERGSEIGAGLIKIAGPLAIITSMDDAFVQAFGA